MNANETELFIRALALENVSVGDLAKELKIEVPKHSRNGKGFVGQLVEKALGADAGSTDSPDFTNLGIELKTIPIAPSGKPME